MNAHISVLSVASLLHRLALTKHICLLTATNSNSRALSLAVIKNSNKVSIRSIQFSFDVGHNTSSLFLATNLKLHMRVHTKETPYKW